jgi:hypothetical protein
MEKIPFEYIRILNRDRERERDHRNHNDDDLKGSTHVFISKMY